MEIRFPNTSSTVGIMIYSGQQCAQAAVRRIGTLQRRRVIKSPPHNVIPAQAAQLSGES
ncbi:MAG: hypothetical protein [Olavius algarvensis Gamma 3 endosymbiont]|nr:MAG: hypothetical protein [Olavius algarvensis Gamma 3 endosymbiont]